MNETLINIITFILIGMDFIVSLVNVFLIKKSYIKIYSVLLVIYSLILLSSLIINRQAHLGELLLVLIFFIFSLIYLIINIDYKYDTIIEDEDTNLFIKIFFSFVFVSIFAIVASNFYFFYKNNDLFPNKSKEQVSNIVSNKDEYSPQSNIAKLNKNNYFQNITNIILYYMVAVILLYYYNRDVKELKKKDEE
jgi:hypothetical protein